MPVPICSYEHYRKNHHLLSINDYDKEREQVLRIIENVRHNGDAALKQYAREFDQAELNELKVSNVEFKAALQSLEPELSEAIEGAIENIRRFHRRQLQANWWDSSGGCLTGQRSLPLQSAGIYIPGGRAAYPSSVLMTVIPAMVAGVQEIYICTPPDSGGRVKPVTLAAASLAGATAVFKAGGAQAVAAFAYGTETVPAVQKVFGPGNIYVTLAKKEVFGHVGIDMLAGPSEIVVVADKDAHPAYIAADMLAQAEHDPLSRSLLITASESLARLTLEHLEEQLATLPRRTIAGQALKHQGAIILVENLERAWPIVNDLAPEHLELHLAQPWPHLDQITSAGAVFIGAHTPITLGDYWAGSNHVLPTGAAARYASALGVYDFCKRSHLLCYSGEALRQAAPHIAALSRAEGLEGHARAVLIRRQEYEPQDQD